MPWNPNDLRNFLEVAKTLNISRAAERIGVGQPALTQGIRRLEFYFGTQLLDRYKTGVRLTAAGKRLRNSGHTTIEVCDRLKEEVLASANMIQGHFTIGCHASVGIYTFPFFLKDLLDGHDNLSINLLHGLSREILEAVVSFKVDFGIVVNPARHPELVIKELCQDSVRFWSAPRALRETLICDPSLIQTQTLISKLRGVHFKRRIESSDLEVIASLAAAGVGVAILPTKVAQKFKNLQIFHKDAPFFDDRICLIYRADRHISVAERLIIDKIRKTNFNENLGINRRNLEGAITS